MSEKEEKKPISKKLKLKQLEGAQNYIEDLKKNKALLIEKFNKACGSEMLISGDHKSFLNTTRLSTGSLTLDYALGGGVPARKTTNVYGEESSSKTTIALKVMADAQKRDRHTLDYIDFNAIKEKNFVFDEENNIYSNDEGEIIEPCSCVLVDIEGTFDADWFRCLGGDPKRLSIIMPEYGEQAVDIIDELISSGLVDVIVVDSLAMMIPIKERDSSAEDGHMGLQAKMLNGAFRKWSSRISTLRKENKAVPTVININQPRQKIGIMFGSNETLPGGNGQKFAASVVVKTKRGKTYYLSDKKDDQKLMPLYKEMNGEIIKNKTAPANIEYEFNLAINDYDPESHEGEKKYEVPFKKGTILEHKVVMTWASKYNMMGKSETTGQFFVQLIGWEEPKLYKKKQDMLNEWIYGDEVKYNLLKQDLLKLMLNRVKEIC
jgi:recombination protein RecA